MKKTNYNFNKKCPTINQFETFLQNKGNTDFNSAFNNHLNHCELCNEAIQGFQSANINKISELLNSASQNIKIKAGKQKSIFIKTLAYAASIIILIGASIIYNTIKNNKTGNQQILAFDYSLLINLNPTNNKTLTQKTTEQFIYIDNCNKIAFNDQFLPPSKIYEALKNNKHITLIRVEVATDNYKCANRIINTIKNNQTIPVLTITKGTKKLTS